MNESKKRLIIVGQGGSGKDYARKELQNLGFIYGVPCTTRPRRENEEEGSDYFFISEEEGQNLLDSGSFYEYAVFNNWIYGTKRSVFLSSNLFVMTPTSLGFLSAEERSDSFIVYLDIPEWIRRERLSARNDADKTERRLKTDEIDFLNFKNFDYRISDPYFAYLGDWSNPKNYRI